MDLTGLVQQAERLANDTETDTGMPRINLTFSEFLQSAEELHSRVTQGGTNDLQANILLGSKGVDLLKLSQKLESLSAQHAIAPLNPIYDTDVEGYLKNERENAIITLIEETNSNVFQSVEKHKMRCMFAEWGEEKERLLNALVGPNQDDFLEVDRHKVPTVLPQSASPTSRLNRVQLLYAEQIQAYNDVHGHGAPKPNLLNHFTRMVEDHSDILDDHVLEMWSVLSHTANVTPLAVGADPIISRQKGSYIPQAIMYLERRYTQYMETVIKKNRLLGMRGGIPGVYNTVIAYVTIRFQNPQSMVGLLDVSDGMPLWPLIYYSLRGGGLNAAIKFLKEAGVCPDLLKLMQHKCQANKQQNADNQIDDTILQETKMEYKNKLRTCSDPFKKAVYALLLACDPHEPHPQVVLTIDDFLWMQLSLLTSVDGVDYNIERMTYGGLQSLILEKYGENYFNASENVPLYFQVLVLTGQFEAALEFLSRTIVNRPHAVHMAIALNELNVLGIPSDMQMPLLSIDPSDAPPMRRLNLGRLIIMYTKTFEETDIQEAVHYYYLLRDFKVSDGRMNLMMTCFIDMVVQHCNETMLELVFGKPHPNDPLYYVGGILSKLPRMDKDKYKLAGMVGDELSNLARFDSAIRLYFIGGQLDMALKLLCSLLTQVVHQRPQEGSLRERLVDIMEHMNYCLSQHKVEVNSHMLRTFTMLSQIMKFFDYYHSGESDLAVEILTMNRIIPITYAEVDECIANVKMAGPDIIKVLPDVLVAAMDLIYQQYTTFKESPGNTSNINVFLLSRAAGTHGKPIDTNEDLITYVRQRARALTNFAATLPYRIPADTSSRLVQVEIMMH